MGESSLSRILSSVAEFLRSIAPVEICFADDVAARAKDFEEIREAEVEQLMCQELLRVDSRGSPEEDLQGTSLLDAALRLLGRIKRDRLVSFLCSSG
ncbi:hypothetical protein HPB47_028152 [Ixodes persulcatus]|uniref:Uncharacterized protein n=1 Tax=Ixodes persulcatus TaxID=34615 RepID=A0AC60PU15_IXOPE|nr:hypothetical protein HPB47_028152 [Ixodes persulcatus]